MGKRTARYIGERLREPSTWAAIGVLGSLLGVRELSTLATPEIAAAIAAVVAIFIPERGA